MNAAKLPAGAFRAGTVPVLDYLKLKIDEAKDFQLVYDLNIGKGGANVVYDVDNSSKISAKFDRVAHFLELRKTGKTEYVYASMDPFTTDIKKIGVPVFGTNALFQTKVDNLTVISNVPSIKAGANMKNTGCIEFWPCNYGPKNAVNVPGASADVYDTGDEMTNPAVSGYGSMQIHNYAAKQTIFAYNKWQTGESADLGNSTPAASAKTKTYDWTFFSNAGQYTVKRLRVLVRIAK